jgi:hypothetical protein
MYFSVCLKKAICLVAISLAFSFAAVNTNEIAEAHASKTDPLNATFVIQGEKIKLNDGRSEDTSAPGSATRLMTSVYDKPVYGNPNVAKVGRLQS